MIDLNSLLPVNSDWQLTSAPGLSFGFETSRAARSLPENDSLETSATDSEKKLVTHFDENNCRPSLDQSIDLELPPLSLSSEDEDSVLKSTGLNRILQ